MEKEKEFSVLVIEDNMEMQELICSILESQYQVSRASNGVEGMELAKLEIPDLILTDVAMPSMDGLEFCKLLRRTIETSHIPVIMITAKTMEEDQLKGYESGATDYIIKPFNVSILQLKVRNMLDSVKRIRSKFSFEKNDFEEVTNNSLDSKWMIQLKEIISQHFQNSTLSVDEVAIELGFSKSTLYRKLKSITGKSFVDLLQEYRLKKAHELLLATELNVSEIAYQVGYTDPGYFSSRYKDFFGQSPSSVGKRKE